MPGPMEHAMKARECQKSIEELCKQYHVLDNMRLFHVMRMWLNVGFHIYINYEWRAKRFLDDNCAPTKSLPHKNSPCNQLINTMVVTIAQV